MWDRRGKRDVFEIPLNADKTTHRCAVVARQATIRWSSCTNMYESMDKDREQHEEEEDEDEEEEQRVFKEKE